MAHRRAVLAAVAAKSMALLAVAISLSWRSSLGSTDILVQERDEVDRDRSRSALPKSLL
jgi:hypothetical protein